MQAHRPRRILRLLVLGLVAGLASAAPAAARTLVVDDGVPTCRDARYHSIQDAVNAAVSGDTVTVCVGTYNESVEVNPPHLIKKLFSRTLHGAVIRGTVALNTHGIHMRGFVVAGPTPASGFGCGAGADPHPVGVDVAGTAVMVDYTRITDIHPSDCSDEGTGMLLEPKGPFDPRNAATAWQNDIEGYGGAGILVGHRRMGGYANVHDNRVTNPAGSHAGGILVSCCVARVASNTVEDNPGAGIFVFAPELSRFGLSIDGNRVSRNGEGIVTNQIGAGVENDLHPLQVTHNFVLNNEGNGIHNWSVHRVLFKDNRSLGNGALDCFDESAPDTPGRWVNNIGVTDSPTTICRPPR